MSFSERHPRGRLLALAATGLFLLTSSTAAFASAPAGAPGATGGSPGGPDGTVSSTPRISTPFQGDGATLVKPDPSIVDLHRQPWDHVVVTDGGSRLVVYFWGGSSACYGLGRVDTVWHLGHLTVRLWTGTKPDQVGMVCPEIAQLYKTVVRLDRPAIGGGY